MDEAHNVALYFRGTGVLSFDRFDEDDLPTGLRDLGNAMVFTLGVPIEKKEHKEYRSATPTTDLEITASKKLTGKFTLDEYDVENLRLFLFANTGTFAIAPLTSGDIRGQLDFVGANDQGIKFHVQLWIIKLFPSGDLGMISDDYGQIPFEFTVEADTVGHANSPYGLITPIGES
jgi:hypothetical protein